MSVSTYEITPASYDALCKTFNVHPVPCVKGHKACIAMNDHGAVGEAGKMADLLPVLISCRLLREFRHCGWRPK
jgi:hypothetical protein